jgi:phage shock protein C
MTQATDSSEERPHRHWEGKRPYRSRTNRMVAGVCGGLGELTGIDFNLIRLLWLVWAFVGGSGLIVYILLALIVPERPVGDVESTPSPIRWQNTGQALTIIVGVGVILVGLGLLLNSLGWPWFGYAWHTFWRLFWPVTLIGIGLLVLVGAFWGQSGWWRHVRLPAAGTVLRRSRTDRMVAGVCGGLGEYLHVDSTLIRIVWAIASLSTLGMGILAYVVAMIVIPEA